MSGGGQTQNKVENKDPWAPAQPHLQAIMAQGANLYNSGAGSQTWGGPLVAPQSSQTQMGINALTGTANALQPNAGQPLAYGQGIIQNNGLTAGYDQPKGIYGNVAQAAGQPTASAANLGGMASGEDAGKNPYLLKMLEDNAARVSNRVNSTMSGAGRFGSYAHGDTLASSIASANNPLLSAAYESDRNRMLSASGQIDASNNAAQATQMGAAAGLTGIQNFGQQNAAQWASMVPQLQQAAFAPGNQLMAVGDYQNQFNQRNIDAQRQLFEQQQAMPWTQLNRFSGAVSGLGPIIGNAGTSTGSVTQEQQTPWTQIAGLGIAGLGMMSDRNEKTDIKKVGTDDATGLPIYSYRYKDDPKTYPKVVGPMAQDIEDLMPGSTSKVGGKVYVKPEAAATLGILALRKKAA
jgi:hypothetical protein